MKSAFFFERTTEPSCVLEMLEQHLDLVTWLEVGMILELFERNGALGLEADVEDDHVVPDFQDLALDDLAFIDRRECSRVQLDHLRFLLGRVLVFVPPVVAVGKKTQLSLLLVALRERCGWRGLFF